MAHQKKGSSTIAASPLRIAALLIGGLSLLALGSAVSCSKKDDDTKPATIPAMAGNPPPAPMAAPPAPALPPAPAAAPAMPAAAAEPPADAPLDPKATITGTIILPAARRADVSPNDVIFMVARRIADNPQARGTLVAVKKMSAASFPIPFVLSARDMMIPTGAFEGEISISVRVDKDGDPMTRRKGDVLGGIPKVKVGTQKLKLVLDQVQKEDESLAAPGPLSAHGSMPGLPPGHP